MTRDFVSIGRLGAPKGVRGDLKVHSHSGESAHFRKLKEVELRPGEGAEGRAAQGASAHGTKAQGPLRLRVARVEGEAPFMTMAFVGYDSPEAARALTGMEVVVPVSAAAQLAPNQWYVDDLVGLSLVWQGEKVAVVRSVLDGGAEPWLEVAKLPKTGAAPHVARSPASKIHATAHRNVDGTSVVPFRKEYVGDVDVAGGTIELLVPELLEE